MPLLILSNGSDISSSLDEGSFQHTEQLQNRKDTCDFRMLQQAVSYGNVITVYEGLRLTQQANSGQKVLNVEDTFPQTNKFRVGDYLIVDYGGANQGTYLIDAIDDTAKTVTLHTNLAANMVKTVKIIRSTPFFAGVCIKAPQKEIGYTGTFSYDVSCVDLSFLFDKEVVVKDFPLMYAREIMGRIVYFFCPNDSSLDLDLFEASWTQAGVGLAMSNDTDRIQGAYSQGTGTSGAGTGTWTKSISSKNLSGYTNARFWWKVTSGKGSMVSALKLRLGTDASNYYEYAMTNIGGDYEDCWNFESCILATPTATVGAPNLAAVIWMQLVVTSTAAISTGGLKFDHILASTGGFTLQNCQRGQIKFDDIRAAYRKPTEVLDDLSKRLLGGNAASSSSQNAYVWYIDYNRDVHLYPQESAAPPFNLSNSPGSQTMNYGKLNIEPDISRLINRITVIGGDAPDSNLYTQSIVFDGSQTSFPLDYPPGSPVTLTVGGVSQTIGIDAQVDESTVQWVVNFKQKLIRKTAGTATPADGTVGVATFYPYKPIVVRVQDSTSIALMKSLTGGDGIFDGTPITDPSIGSFQDARIRGLAELRQYSNAILTATFETDYDGLHAGQVITITDVNRSINQSFLIQKVSSRQRFRDRFVHSVTAASVLYGFIEFFQMLVKRAQKVDLTPADFLQIIMNLDETVTFADSYIWNHNSKTVKACLVDIRRILFDAEAGSASANGVIVSNGIFGTPVLFTNWYASFGGTESGTVQFAASNYQNAKELQITANVGGAGNEAKARQVFFLPAYSSTLYTIDYWIRVAAALTNVSSGGVKLVIKEYSAQGPGGTPLATNTLVSGLTAKQDFTWYRSTFTTNASTAWIGIEFSIFQAAGTAALSDILITPTKAETQSPPGVASYSTAT